MELVINYYLDTNETVGSGVDSGATQEEPRLLGSEISRNIGQILCPSNTQSHTVTITKFFANEIVHRWVVQRIEHQSNEITNVFLTPRAETRREVFLNKTRIDHPRTSQKIQRGTLVEVDFGFVQQIKKDSGDIRSNKRYPDMLHHGEMHKRRLAIVVGAKNNMLRVVPITSLENQNTADKTIFEVSTDSLEELIGYNSTEKISYAICGLMQTISMTRVLPPISVQKGRPRPFRDTRYTHKLCVNDLKQFERALSATVGCGDYQEVKDERNQLRLENRDIERELDSLRAENTALQRLTSLDQRHSALIEIMVDWKRSLNTNMTEQDAKAEIETEIEDYMKILSDV